MEADLNKTRLIFMRIIFAIAVLVMCSLLSACSSGFSMSSASANDGVAATIEGEDITEQDVSDYIASFRDGMGYSNDSAWAQYLADNNETASDIRHTTIVQLASDIIIQKEADRLGLSVTDEEIDQKVQEFRSNLMAEDDDTWNSTLEQYKTSESGLRERYRKEILKEKAFEKDVPRTDPTDQDIQSYIEENLAGTTTKRFEVFYNPNYSIMQNQLVKIQKAGSKKAALANARKYAIGVNEAAKAKSNKKIVYEEFGWDIDPETTTAMKQELSDLKKGNVSKVLVSDASVNAYEIIHVLDVYTFPEKNPDISKLPSSLKKTLSALTRERVWTISCNSWLAKQINDNLTENDMPQGLAYDIEPASSDESTNTASEAQN